MRLDNYLVENEFVDSRNKAQTIIKDGLVTLNETTIKKSSFKVEEGDVIVVKEHKNYVSRAAIKLENFLHDISLDVSQKIALDIGASTGGFTQVLLERGVSEVSAVDVGTKQLHSSIKNDTRVFSYESCDIRNFTSEKSFNLVVSDVAFISLLYILDDVQRLATDDIILLFKPQFEVGREVKRDKNGVVLDTKAIAKARKIFEDACKLKGWNLIEQSTSKLTGKEGNIEYCYYYKK